MPIPFTAIPMRIVIAMEMEMEMEMELAMGDGDGDGRWRRWRWRWKLGGSIPKLAFTNSCNCPAFCFGKLESRCRIAISVYCSYQPYHIIFTIRHHHHHLHLHLHPCHTSFLNPMKFETWTPVLPSASRTPMLEFLNFRTSATWSKLAFVALRTNAARTPFVLCPVICR